MLLLLRPGAVEVMVKIVDGDGSGRRGGRLWCGRGPSICTVGKATAKPLGQPQDCGWDKGGRLLAVPHIGR